MSLSTPTESASFELVNREQFIWSVLATDCDFAPDGFTWSDYQLGYAEQGTHLQVLRSNKLNDPTSKEVKTLLADGFRRTPGGTRETARAYNNRIRQESPVRSCGKEAIEPLAEVATKGNKLAVARDLGTQSNRSHRREALEILLYLVKDPDADVRGNVNKVVGDCSSRAASSASSSA